MVRDLKLRAAVERDFPQFVAGIHAKHGLQPPEHIQFASDLPAGQGRLTEKPDTTKGEKP